MWTPLTRTIQQCKGGAYCLALFGGTPKRGGMVVFEDPPDPPRKWGCFDGPPKHLFLIVQDGYDYVEAPNGMSGTRVPRWIKIQDTSTDGCHSGTVKECEGCCWLPSALARRGEV